MDNNPLTLFIKDIHRFSNTIGSISMTPSRLLRTFYKQYRKEPSNSYAEGRYCGILFEYYLSPILFQATNFNRSVRWFIPSRERINLLKRKKRKNRLAYNSAGEIILHDGYAPTAEFDGILKIGKKQILLIEMKYSLSGGKNLAHKMFSRLRLFKAAFNQEPFLFLVVPEEISLKSGQELVSFYESHPKVWVVKVRNFTKFREMFEANKFPKKQKKLSQFSSKVKAPHEVFSRSIKFGSYRKILKKEFDSYVRGSVDIQSFFSKNQRYIDLLGKIPIGRIDATLIMVD